MIQNVLEQNGHYLQADDVQELIQFVNRNPALQPPPYSHTSRSLMDPAGTITTHSISFQALMTSFLKCSQLVSLVK